MVIVSLRHASEVLASRVGRRAQRAPFRNCGHGKIPEKVPANCRGMRPMAVCHGLAPLRDNFDCIEILGNSRAQKIVAGKPLLMT